jgi:hypothetical protein
MYSPPEFLREIVISFQKESRMSRKLFALFTLFVIAFVGTGCSLKYKIDEPAGSGFTYQNVADKKPVVMRVVDNRNDKKFVQGISGLKSVNIVFENVDDPMGWLGNELQKEFVSRGVPMQVVPNGSAAPADVTLTVEKYQVVNHRASGFSAWEAYHIFLATVTMGDKSCTIPAFFFNSKVPVWSMDEIGSPCLSVPMSVMVKEIASKINRCIFNYSVSDENVQKMAESALKEVKPDTDNACFPSIALGSTNNPAAMKTLEKIAESDDSLVHNCAVSAMGTLGAQGQFGYLSGKFALFSNNDKVMPLAAIGDIGGSQSLDFIGKVKTSELYEDENSVKYCADLYLSK